MLKGGRSAQCVTRHSCKGEGAVQETSPETSDLPDVSRARGSVGIVGAGPASGLFTPHPSGCAAQTRVKGIGLDFLDRGCTAYRQRQAVIRPARTLRRWSILLPPRRMPLLSPTSMKGDFRAAGDSAARGRTGRGRRPLADQDPARRRPGTVSRWGARGRARPQGRPDRTTPEYPCPAPSPSVRRNTR
jgi:hypothetical protein